uniref:Uncharacterized protein AlNc14C88G5588 n=1 Tax=Albugo laibachii Nc14 TaxID=890382 RepID=F0WG58_9STRA|nr:conserved hypothetical protein [Albugo laibachii Nc14]|eukprot:CCA20193.1 conserved hypothetical protein [Albugo laibachii Nc14]
MTQHQVLMTVRRDYRRVIIVGDVHGCLDELQQLLTECNATTEHDLIVLVGDLVNKGPKSVEVLQFVRTSPNMLSVRGNHDEAALTAYSKWKNDEDVPGKYDYVKEFSTEDVEFLRDLPYTIKLPEFNVMVVHAGIIPGLALQDQDPVLLTKMRFLERQEGSMVTETKWKALEKCQEETEAISLWAKQWNGPEHIYFGHDAKRGLQVRPLSYLIFNDLITFLSWKNLPLVLTQDAATDEA